VPLIRLAAALPLVIIGLVSAVSGVRDGVVRRHIRPRWWDHDLTGTSAVVFGGVRAFVGLLCALGAVYLAISWR
jgi:hypothetical protein